MNKFTILLIFGFLRLCESFLDVIQYSSVKNSNESIIWNTTEYDTFVTSEPLCIDSQKTTIRRIRTEYGWLPEKPTICASTKPSKPFTMKCADNHTLFQNKYCIYISEPQSWTSNSSIFNLENIVESDYLEILTTNFYINKMWLPVRRTEPFGKFVWSYPQSNNDIFNHSTLIKSVNFQSVLHDCVLVTNIKLEKESKKYTYEAKITDCKAKHRIVQIYKLSARYVIVNEILHYSIFGNKAFYVTNEKYGNVCKKLAQPRLDEDIFVIQQLIANSPCKIDVSFLFPNKTEYNSLFKSFQFAVMEQNTWKLKNSTTFNNNCSVCEIDYTKYFTNLFLKPNKNHSALILTLYSIQQFKTISCKTFGLEDVHLNFYGQEIPVLNNYNKTLHEIEKVDNRSIWKMQFKNEQYNYFQCVGKTFPKSKEIITKNVFFGNIKYGREYAFIAKIKSFCNKNICDPQFNNFYKDMENCFAKIVDSDKIKHFRAIKINSIFNGTIDLLFHVRTKDKIKKMNVELKVIKNLLIHKLRYYNKNETYVVTIDEESIKSCDGCPADITYTNNNKKLIWKYTEIGNTAIPNEICLLSNKLPLTRKCRGNSLYGGEWTKITENCEENIKYSNITENLKKLSDKATNESVLNILSTVSNLTHKKMIFQPVDMYYISQILKNITESNLEEVNNEFVAENISTIIDNLIGINSTTLQIAGRSLNSTNDVLFSTDILMEQISKNSLNENGTFQVIKPNYLHYAWNPFKSNIIGVGLIRPDVPYQAPFTEYHVILLTEIDSQQKLLSTEFLEIGVFLPDDLLYDMKLKSINQSVTVLLDVFYNDSLFIEDVNASLNKVASKVFSISISGYDNYLFSSIRVIVKPEFINNNTKDIYCGFWDFGSVSENEVYPVQWKIDETINAEFENSVKICNINHLTHFALLLRTSFQDYYYPTDNETIITENVQRKANNNDKILEYLTAIGCILSAIGICGIILTAILFKVWREKVGTKILLNVSGCILLQIILLYFNFEEDHTACVITGSLLHYSILCGFAWSLIMAFLQYLRFVRVLGGTTSHLILKSTIVGWGFPIIPVAFVLILDLNNYNPNDSFQKLNRSLCYPNGIVLYATVFIPVALIVLANLVIFCVILYNIFWKTTTISHNINDKKMLIKQFKLTILLFFLFGLTWIFGFLATSGFCPICLYLFCATAPFQGFILFLFYVIFDIGTCSLWIRLLKSKITTSPNTSTAVSKPTNEGNTFLSKDTDSHSNQTLTMQNLSTSYKTFEKPDDYIENKNIRKVNQQFKSKEITKNNDLNNQNFLGPKEKRQNVLFSTEELETAILEMKKKSLLKNKNSL